MNSIPEHKKIYALETENKLLKKQILQAKKKRKEATENAERLAESNYYLQNCLWDVYHNITNIKMENEELIREKQRLCAEVSGPWTSTPSFPHITS